MNPEDMIGRLSGPLSLRRRIANVVALLGGLSLLLALGAAYTAVFVRVSVDNYPGGRALQFVHTRFASELQPPLQPSLTATWPRGGAGDALPACAEGDVTAPRGSLGEWWRQCLAKSCPSVAPWSRAWRDSAAAAALGGDAAHGASCIELGGGGGGSCCTGGGGGSCCTGGGGGSGGAEPRPVRVHIDGAAAEAGVSRFGEAWSARGWSYSKAENLTLPEHFEEFDVLLTGRRPTFHERAFVEVDAINGRPRMRWPSRAAWFGAVDTEPTIYVLRRRPAEHA